MKKILLSVFLTFTIYHVNADSINMNNKINAIERQVKQIDANQLNYRIEKDLLKETYSNNYERINLAITLVLGVTGIFGYLGLRDINSIKKEYEKELNDLRQIQTKFDLKSQQFETDKVKFEEDLKAIIKENEEQSRKIKLIELKDKVRSFLKDNNLASALEFANAALDISKEDVELLNLKGSILCRLNQLKESVQIFSEALKINPKDPGTILNAAECYYFVNDTSNAKRLIEENKSLFQDREGGKLLELFNVIELYHENKVDTLKEIAKTYVTIDNLRNTNKRFQMWSLMDAIYFIYYQPDNDSKNIIQNILWYWDGQINGETLLLRLNLEIPQKI